jgi:hypothetical protein
MRRVRTRKISDQEVPSELSGNEISIDHWRARLLWTPKMGESRRLVRLCYILGSPGWCPSGIMDYTTGTVWVLSLCNFSCLPLLPYQLLPITFSLRMRSCFSLFVSLLVSKSTFRSGFFHLLYSGFDHLKWMGIHFTVPGSVQINGSVA